MTQKHKIQLFEEKQVRTVWDDEQEKWFFSIVDVCGVLTEQPDYDHAKNYWKVLKHRLVKEDKLPHQESANCHIKNRPTVTFIVKKVAEFEI